MSGIFGCVGYYKTQLLNKDYYLIIDIFYNVCYLTYKSCKNNW